MELIRAFFVLLFVFIGAISVTAAIDAARNILTHKTVSIAEKIHRDSYDFKKQ